MVSFPSYPHAKILTASPRTVKSKSKYTGCSADVKPIFDNYFYNRPARGRNINCPLGGGGGGSGVSVILADAETTEEPLSVTAFAVLGHTSPAVALLRDNPDINTHPDCGRIEDA